MSIIDLHRRNSKTICNNNRNTNSVVLQARGRERERERERGRGKGGREGKEREGGRELPLLLEQRVSQSNIAPPLPPETMTPNKGENNIAQPITTR